MCQTAISDYIVAHVNAPLKSLVTNSQCFANENFFLLIVDWRSGGDTGGEIWYGEMTVDREIKQGILRGEVSLYR